MISKPQQRCCKEPQESLWAWDRVFLLPKLWREHTSGLTLLPLFPLLQQQQPSCGFQSTFEGAMNIEEVSPIPLVHGDSETRPLAEHAKRMGNRYARETLFTGGNLDESNSLRLQPRKQASK